MVSIRKDDVTVELVAVEDAYKLVDGFAVVPSADIHGKQLTRNDTEALTGKSTPIDVSITEVNKAVGAIMAMEPEAAVRVQQVFPGSTAATQPQPIIAPVAEYPASAQLAPEPLIQAPGVQVRYSMESGVCTTRVHKVIVGDSMIMTVFDMNYDMGTSFSPREDKAFIRLEVRTRDGSDSYEVVSTGLRCVDAEANVEYVCYIRVKSSDS